MPWWFVVFCLLLFLLIGVLVRTVRLQSQTFHNLAGLRQEVAALRDIAATMEQVMVLQLALWRITGLPIIRRR